MKRYFLLAFAAMCCLLACQKEPDGGLVTPSTCQLDQVIYYNQNVATDTIGYEYSGGKVSKVNYADYYTEMEYAGTQISRKNYYVNGTTTLAGYDEFTYNGDGTLARVNFYLVDASVPQPFLFFQYNFAYNAGRLEHSEVLADTSGAGPELLAAYFYEYTGDNITQVIENDLVAQSKDTVQYTFDNKLNYYSRIPNLWLSDNLFTDFNGIVLPFALSANNVVTLGEPGTSSTVSYSETDKEDIETLSINGAILARYKYKCQ